MALAEWLLEHGAGPNATGHPGKPGPSLYEGAMRLGHVELAELLVRHGARRTPVKTDPVREFAVAAFALEREAVTGLVASHTELLHSTKVIFAAAEKDRADVVELLLDLGVPIELENERKQRPLHAAAWSDAVGVAKLLIDRGAEVDPVETEWNNTPLDFAVYGQHRRMIDFLARYSRDIWNLVFIGAVDRVRDVLRESPERAKVVSGQRQTPLMWLPDAEDAALEIIALFESFGADLALRGSDGLTAADRARRRGLGRAAAILEGT
jgi:ankyrin repeat protein